MIGIEEKVGFLSYDCFHKSKIIHASRFSTQLLDDIETLFKYGIRKDISAYKQHILDQFSKIQLEVLDEINLPSVVNWFSNTWARYWLLYDAAANGFFSAYLIHELETLGFDIQKLVTKEKTKLFVLIQKLADLKENVDLKLLQNLGSEHEIEQYLNHFDLRGILDVVGGEDHPYKIIKDALLLAEPKSSGGVELDDYEFVVQVEKLSGSYMEKLYPLNKQYMSGLMNQNLVKHIFDYDGLFNSYFLQSKTIRAVGVSSGIHMGRTKIVYNLNDCKKVQKGDVILCYATWPDMLPAILKAGAIIAEDGGLLSHTAIVSRELGIPAVVGAKGAINLIGENKLVKIDGSTGIIKIIE